jgi:hypothetical protein
MAVPGNGQGKRAHHEPGLLHSLWVGPLVINILDFRIIKKRIAGSNTDGPQMCRSNRLTLSNQAPTNRVPSSDPIEISSGSITK